MHAQVSCRDSVSYKFGNRNITPFSRQVCHHMPVQKKHIVSGMYMSQKPNCPAMLDRAAVPAPPVW
jgi:hypothetical protein